MRKVRVELADDHLLAREGLCRILEGEKDIEVVAATENGEQAVELAKRTMPDVAIIDIVMPGLGGIKATREIKRVSPRTAVLIVSAYKYDHYVFAALEAGADGYLLKDNMLPQRLLDSIRMAHAGKNVFDDEVSEIIRKIAVSRKGKQRVDTCNLTSRELEVLRLVMKGMSNKKIASELYISEQTVATHFVNIFNKLRIQTRTEAVLCALRKGWVTLEEDGREGEA